MVWAGKGRSAETLDGFFNLLGPSGCEGIALVTVDLAASWQKALRARVPHARVVFDRFHVERLASDAVDEVRRAEQRRVGAKATKALKGTRFCLLKHPARLKPGEKRRLETLRRQNRALDRAYRLKEYLAIILEQATPDEAPDLLDEWLAWAARSRLRPIVTLARTVRKHAAGILAYLDTKMTMGPWRASTTSCGSSHGGRTAFTPTARSSRCCSCAAEAKNWHRLYPLLFEETPIFSMLPPADTDSRVATELHADARDVPVLLGGCYQEFRGFVRPLERHRLASSLCRTARGSSHWIRRS